MRANPNQGMARQVGSEAMERSVDGTFRLLAGQADIAQHPVVQLLQMAAHFIAGLQTDQHRPDPGDRMADNIAES